MRTTKQNDCYSLPDISTPSPPFMLHSIGFFSYWTSSGFGTGVAVDLVLCLCRLMSFVIKWVLLAAAGPWFGRAFPAWESENEREVSLSADHGPERESSLTPLSLLTVPLVSVLTYCLARKHKRAIEREERQSVFVRERGKSGLLEREGDELRVRWGIFI